MDLLLKQYTCFAEKGHIDFNLINITSKSTGFKDIPSILPNKYYYESDHKLENLQTIFYSEQRWVRSDEEYENLFVLLTRKSITLEDFEDFQRKKIESLIEQRHLHIDSAGYVKIKDLIFISLIGDLYKEGVLLYYSYTKGVQRKIDEMEKDGLLYTEATLLSSQEADYFDYFLNRKLFTNGPEIRNKNIHGYVYSSEDEAHIDYLILLRTVILILLKIDFEITYRPM